MNYYPEVSPRGPCVGLSQVADGRMIVFKALKKHDVAQQPHKWTYLCFCNFVVHDGVCKMVYMPVLELGLLYVINKVII